MLGLGFRIDHHIVPGDLLAGVGGDSAHHGGGARFRHGFGLIDRLALIDMIQGIDLLLDMSTGGLGQVRRYR